MTQATKAQLAEFVPPMVRDYIEAAISEAVAEATQQFNLKAAGLDATDRQVGERLAQMELFERQVRSHLGVYVPE